MNILYLHGIDSRPNPGKIEILEEKGHNVYALHLDYKKQVNSFDILYKQCRESNVQYIVGSSIGGYYGYWLGHSLGLNQLLFNPAMPFRSVKVQEHNIKENPMVSSYVVLGQNDDIIPSNLNVHFFSTKDNIRLMTCQWLGHQVDLQTFREMISMVGL